MATQRQLDRLISLKIKKKALDVSIKELETAIIEKRPPQSYTGIHGKLDLITRSNFSVPNNTDLIEEVGQTTFNEKATMSASKIKTAVGESRFEELIDEGIVRENAPSRYYKLTTLD